MRGHGALLVARIRASGGLYLYARIICENYMRGLYVWIICVDHMRGIHIIDAGDIRDVSSAMYKHCAACVLLI
jgi:hypothetical protein